MLFVPIDSETEKRLEDLGARSPSAKTALQQRAIAAALEDLEDARQAEERLASPGKRYTFEEVERNLGLGDGLGD